MSAIAHATPPASLWKTEDSKLFYMGNEVALHGFSTTCTEYLLRGIGSKCWAKYNWSDPSNIITTLDQTEVDGMLSYLDGLTAPGVKGVIRVPMTGSSWLGT